MFSDNSLANKIRDIENITELSIFINNNYKFLSTLEGEIIRYICTTYKTEYVNTDLFDTLFFNTPQVTTIEFNILEAYVNSCISITNLDIPKKYLVLFLLLLNQSTYVKFQKNNIITRDMEVALIEDIMNMNNNPIYTVIKIEGFLNTYNGLSGFFEKIGDQHIYDSGDPILINLYTELRDIYSDRNKLFSTFKSYHYFYIIYSHYINTVQNVNDRFKVYFGNETTNIVMDIIFIVNTFNDNYETLDSYIHTLIYNSDKGYSDKKHISAFSSLLYEIHHLMVIIDTLNNKLNSFYDYIMRVTRDNLNIPNPTMQSGDPALELFKIELAMEAYDKNSLKMNEAEKKIYKAYKNYKNAEDKVDSQLTKALQGGKKLLVGDVREEIIEGKKYTAISLLKKALGAASIFSVSKVAAIIALVVRYFYKKNVTYSERKKIILELESELEILEEKIEDAKGDANREAKYQLMRLRTELKTAIEKLKFGLEADEKSISTAKNIIKNTKIK